MNIRDRWRDFWFRKSSYFDLALLRVGALGLQCYLFLSGGFRTALHVNSLPDELFYPRPVLQILMAPWGSMNRPDPESVVIILWLVVVLGFVSFLGFLTNISLSLFAVGFIFLQGYSYSFGDAHHPEAIMALGLLALAFSPCGKVLSVDALIRKRLFRGGQSVGFLDYGGEYAYWPIRFIQLIFPLMYLSAVISKLTRSGLDWVNGFTLQYAMIQDGYRHGSELAIWLSQFHDFLKLSEWVVLIYQATFFLILFFPKLKWVYLPLGLCFHLGTYFTLKAPFPQWILFYAVYIPWAQVIRYLAGKQVTVKITVPT